MGLLTVSPDSDERLMVGAYISRGATLFRVHSKTPSQVVLEDAYRSGWRVKLGREMSVKKGTTRADILKNYQLERRAR